MMPEVPILTMIFVAQYELSTGLLNFPREGATQGWGSSMSPRKAHCVEDLFPGGLWEVIGSLGSTFNH